MRKTRFAERTTPDKNKPAPLPLRKSSLARLLSAAILLGLLLAACSGGSGSANPTALPPFQSPTAAGAASNPIPQTAGTATAFLPGPASPTASAGQTGLPAATLPPTVPTSQPTAAVQAPTPAGTAGIPDPSGLDWAQIASGLDSPVGIASARDNSGRLFVLEKPGRIRILNLKGDQLLPDPFLDISDRVGSRGSEQGLLGLAFDPNYSKNGYFYVNYTDNNGNTSISRFRVSADSNRADPSTEKALLHIQQPFPNHNGGGLAFGPDGYLYLGLGDGGSQGDPHRNGQSVQVLLGKLLRIDVSKGDPYTIPADNPFAKGGGKAEIWAYGLRNPWRFTFDRKTGDLYIADVGQDVWEEIDYLPAGSPGGTNFGWSLREGKHPYQDTVPPGVKLTDPVAEYSHSEGGCAIIGGPLYRGAALPDWQGVYFYGDYCSGKIWGLKKTATGWVNQLIFQTSFSISSFGEDGSGEIYLADQHGGIYRLVKK